MSNEFFESAIKPEAPVVCVPHSPIVPGLFAPNEVLKEKIYAQSDFSVYLGLSDRSNRWGRLLAGSKT